MTASGATPEMVFVGFLMGGEMFYSLKIELFDGSRESLGWGC